MSMDIIQIQDLIKFVAKSGVNEVSIEEEAFKITIKTNQAPTYVTATVPTAPPVQQPIAAPVAAPAAVSQPPAAKTEDTSKYITSKSPMIGTFYRSPSPEKPVFVNIGDEITAGKV